MHSGITYRFAAVRPLVLAAIWLCGSGSLFAQTFTTLYLFGPGGNPEGKLVEGRDGNLYGTTYGYLGKGNGMIFKITPSGSFTELHGGGEYAAGLTLGSDGNFYGTSYAGGTGGDGFVFKMTSSGALTTLYTFAANSNGIWANGNFPRGLVQASDGNFYGTTYYGGTNTCISGGTNYGCGTVYRITPGGTLTTLYNFCSKSGCADGQNPGTLVLGADGSLYGTTLYGGGSACNGGCGTIFKITTTGTFATLHSFDSTDGAVPAALIQATDGNIYGTTSYGGSGSSCSSGCGTIFKMTSAGVVTTLHSFGISDGSVPDGMIQGADGNFYGVTEGGGTSVYGTIFKITSTGTITTLHSFDKTDGANPTALVQHSNGSFYGTTVSGGKTSYHFCQAYCGTLFSLSVP